MFLMKEYYLIQEVCMSPKNDFKAFSISDNANVVSQEKYEEN